MTEDKKYRTTFLRPSDYKTTTWKNGKGSSTEIAIFPNSAIFPADPFLWRISSASLSKDCAFSQFPGYHRYFALTQQGAINLNFKTTGQKRLLNSGEVCDFDGSEEIFAELLTGSVRDLNLIFDKRKVTAKFEMLQVTSKGCTLICQSKACFIVGLQGTIDAAMDSNSEKYVLQSSDTLRVEIAKMPSKLNATLKAQESEATCAFLSLDW